MQGTLFHLPEIVKQERRGRPKIEIPIEKQHLIRFALRGGMSANAVGRATGIDPKTIRKYFYGSPLAKAEKVGKGDRGEP